MILSPLDLQEPSPELTSKCKSFYRGNILDRVLISEIEINHQFEIIYHLAGLLSSTGERNPKLAHEVNVDGSINVFQIAQTHTLREESPVTFMFSSSIAAYGVRPGDDQESPVKERQFLTPVTMYGVNKLYIEQLGRYFSNFYQAGRKTELPRVDFRCVRFPGLISSETVPTGGTSDYGPEMLHAAAEGEPYNCFVRPDSMLPFMIMSDGVRSLIQLSKADSSQLNHRIYNVTSFSVSAEEIRQEILRHFPDAEIDFDPDPRRQMIVDSWPNRVDDTPARNDWDWEPEYGFEEAFEKVLVPRVRELYR